MFENYYLFINKYLNFIYLLFAIILTGLSTILVPPFQNPDEPAHFYRAEEVSRLELVPSFVYDSQYKIPQHTDSTLVFSAPGGYKVDKGVQQAQHPFTRLSCCLINRVDSSMFIEAKQYKWGSGFTRLNFGNTAIYPPTAYIIPSIGIFIGKCLQLNIIQTYTLSRIFNCVTAVMIGFLALFLAKRSRILFFIALLFPMCVSLFASVSQDASLICFSFLLVAIIDHAEFNSTPQYSKWHFLGMVLLMTLIIIAKPPYTPLVFIFLLLSIPLRTRVLLFSIPLFILMIWFYIDHYNLAIPFAPVEMHINAKLQVSHILHHPFRFIKMFFKPEWMAINQNAKMFVGILGWLDTYFPRLYYKMAFMVFFLGLVTCFEFTRKDSHFKVKVGLLFFATITLIAVMTAQYVTWTALDSPVFSGMQGRYLYPIFPFVALGVSGYKKIDKISPYKSVFLILIVSFPIITILNLVNVLIHRYYL
ncbi:DUF2142 domain-containing protein [Mucilaginibacter robiniae]|uniref:DUF2142 domain-containing protein n=1 Tax=Mucilaginibacter robiniae TaxID=2728022 RepID=A0A7L5E285_9SPHI|nr:DUF2142 domain-containing protein [Mucilaginibacter robiniae]QJD97141.1 DUF2142 domain-containing protein [Mucilaginibacter robiniae]